MKSGGLHSSGILALRSPAKYVASEQGASLRHAPPSNGLQADDARITIVADQPSGLGELSVGAFDFAFEGKQQPRTTRSVLRHGQRIFVTFGKKRLRSLP